MPLHKLDLTICQLVIFIVFRPNFAIYSRFSAFISVFIRKKITKLICIFTNMQPSVKTYTVNEAREKLENYCIYQDRCHKEIREKLYTMRMIPEAIEQITIHLIEEKYLNEERFARSFARGKFKTKKWGKTRIIRELRSREISKNVIDLALTEINEDDYIATFKALAEKRMTQLTSENDKYKKRKKLADYLQYRGWPMHWIYEKATELIP